MTPDQETRLLAGAETLVRGMEGDLTPSADILEKLIAHLTVLHVLFALPALLELLARLDVVLQRARSPQPLAAAIAARRNAPR
jgi:hypothetical protein